MTEGTIEPITASADGKRNAYCLSCEATQQKMSYAACLNRARIIDSGEKYPKDWNGCDRSAGRDKYTCPARAMRIEEEAAGKAIYFVPRGTLATAAATAGRWVVAAVKKVVNPPAPAPRPKTQSLLDAMGDDGGLAAAVTAAAMNPGTPAAMVTVVAAAAPAPAPVLARGPIPRAMPGESPLQMALRLKQEREAAK